MGPFVIHAISSSGANKLATIDGQEMPNWISGCQLKKYHLPQTNEMLEREHASKERKNKKINEIQQAQIEAKERVAKRKRLQQAFHPSKAVQQNHITTDEDYEDGLEPIINVNIGTD